MKRLNVLLTLYSGWGDGFSGCLHISAVLVLLLFVGRTVADDSTYLTMMDLVKASIPLEQHYTWSDAKEMRVRYRLFLPSPYDKKQTYPLILWLHGFGDHGEDNISQLMHIDATLYYHLHADECRFFVLAPECPRTPPNDWLTPISAGSAGEKKKLNDMLAIAIDLLDRIQQAYPIDKRRITVVGICGGGSAGWELLRREPVRFAALVPLGAGAPPNRQFAGRPTTPVWAFHAIGDKRASFKEAEETVSDYQAPGGVAQLTMMNDTNHDCWYPAFQEHDLLHWILAQRRDDPMSPLPGHYRFEARVSWWWRNGRLPIFVTALLFGLAVLSSRHLKKPSAATDSHDGADGTHRRSSNTDLGTDNCMDFPPMHDPLKPKTKVPDFILSSEDVP